MELQVTNGRIGTIETVFDDLDERPVDCDFMLPDYMPEITAILKCRMKPVVQSHQVSGDRVMADGTVHLQLLYLGEDRRCVRCYEHTQPFSSAFTVKDLKSSDTVRLSARTNYVNCRATAPRRVDVHGAFSVRLTVTAESNKEVICHVSADDLHTRGCDVVGSVPAGGAEKTVSVNEVLELGAAVSQALVRGEATAVVTECKQMPNKAVIKGDVLLESVHIANEERGELFRAKHRIPFSQILDVEGLTEDTVCDCRARITQCDMRVMADPAGENRLLSVAIKLTVSLVCYRTESGRLVTDAYHTAYPLKTESCAVEVCRVAFVRSDAVGITLVQDLPDSDIAEILDVWCEPMTVECRENAGQTAVCGEMLVGMLTKDAEGIVSYYERPAAFEEVLPDTCEKVEAVVTPVEVSYVRNGGQLEVRMQAAVHRTGLQTEHHRALTRMTVDDAAPYTDDGTLAGCCLKVCFAEAGESVWDLARRERTSPEALKEENGLQCEVLEQDTMLLIPMK